MNENVSADELQTYSDKRICERHFKHEDIMGGTRKLLRKDAVPIPVPGLTAIKRKKGNKDLENEFLTVTKSVRKYEREKLDNNIELTMNDISNIPDPYVPSYSNELQHCSPKVPPKNSAKLPLSNNQAKRRRNGVCSKEEFEKVLYEKNLLTCFDKIKFPSPYGRTFLKMLSFHKNRKPWLQDEKELSITLFEKSPSIYKCLRELFVNMPSVNAIRSWIAESKKNYDDDGPEYLTASEESMDEDSTNLDDTHATKCQYCQCNVKTEFEDQEVIETMAY